MGGFFMQTYNFIKTSTAGNRTGFILGKNAYINRKKILKTLLKEKNLEAEQYAFLWKEYSKLRMEMAGGELCGGAILASSILIGEKNREICILTGSYKLKNILGFEKGKTWFNEVQLPQSVFISSENIKWQKIRGKKVILDGIAYFVTKEIMQPKDIKMFMQLDRQMRTQAIPAIGIVEINDNFEMNPYIWVKSTDTVIAEQGCTTGSIAAQFFTGQKSGIWMQPSGKQIQVELGGNIYISAQINMLSEGKLYISN